MGFGLGFSMFTGIFGLMLLAFVGFFIYTIARNVQQNRKNDASPRLTVEAQVVSRRTDVTQYHSGENHSTHSTTNYFVTFQVESGDRLELELSGAEFGMLAEGDFGWLSFQGTRFLSFERK